MCLKAWQMSEEGGKYFNFENQRRKIVRKFLEFFSTCASSRIIAEKKHAQKRRVAAGSGKVTISVRRPSQIFRQCAIWYSCCPIIYVMISASILIKPHKYGTFRMVSEVVRLAVLQLNWHLYIGVKIIFFFYQQLHTSWAYISKNISK